MRRRLFWHAILLLLLALVIGGVVPLFRNPRMGLTAHVGTLMSGLFVGLAGALWNDLRLSARATAASFWCTLVANYLNSVGLVVAAVFGTSGMTPIAGAGFAGLPWQEMLADALLIGGAIPTFAVCVLLLRGLGGRE